ncbi:MAG: chlorophyll a/b-binding protein [Cyanobacteria bacterium J06614_10]
MASIQPTKVPKMERPKKGFNQYAEQLNGRAAMIGIVGLVLVELLTGKGLLSLLGLT